MNRILGSLEFKKLTGPLTALKWMSGALVAMAILIPVTGCTDQRGVLSKLPPGLLRLSKPQPRYQAPPPLLAPPVPVVRQATRNVTIIVDAGHGGHDPGTRGTGYSYVPEKTLNLSIANDLTQQLRSRGANVVMTRTGDWFIELSNRPAMGRSSGAELFVSIHIDASRNTGASGMTVYVNKSPSVGSQQAGQHINNALRAAGLETRGVRRKNLCVLRESSCAAVLVECGFLSNPGDARALNQPDHQQRIATAIAEGIADYFGW
jgi:N-acetylmuramoyl-L-alanine amidase